MKIGIECGGTFTDVVVLDDDGRLVDTNKVFSTPHDPSVAVNDALKQLPQDVLDRAALFHGSTVATNALIERSGARTGLITTRGFRDLVFLQRQDRASMYDLTIQKPTAIVERDDIVEIVERTDAHGVTATPLDEDSVRDALRTLRERGVEAVAVALLHSYANPEHEERVAEMIAEELPGMDYALSSRSSREFREYERTSTTTIDAFLRPMVSRYLRRLGDTSSDFGIADLRVMQSNGGMVPAGLAASNPLTMLRSGPAAGVAGVVATSKASGHSRIVTMDMGGTSTDVTIIVDGAPELTTETVAGGLPVKVPMIDIFAVGAGGGSLVGRDSGGLLTVGPRSAGADPGPVCYGRGGTLPTVTDANVVRGLIRPESFLGGTGRLDPVAAVQALRPLATAFGKSVEEVAEDVFHLASVHMAGAIRMATTERGHDARAFALFAYGGAGPLHAAAVAEELGITEVVVPPHSGLASAYGLLTAGFRREFSSTVLRDLSGLGSTDLTGLASGMRDGALERLESEGVDAGDARFTFTADMRYAGQGFELLVDLGDDVAHADLRSRFEATQERRYGYLDEDKEIQLVTMRLTVTFDNPHAVLPTMEFDPAASTHHRTIVEGGRDVAAVFRSRAGLAIADSQPGPAVIEDTTSTTVVPPGWTAHVDERTNLILERAS